MKNIGTESSREEEEQVQILRLEQSTEKLGRQSGHVSYYKGFIF